MHIIFQFGEFTVDSSFLSDLVVAIVGTTLGGFITVGLFFYQLKRTKLAEEEKKKQFEKDRLVYFTATLDRVVDMVKRQIEQLDIFTDSLDKDPLTIPILGMYALHDVERQSNKIDHTEYYHAFANQHRSTEGALKKFDTIYSSIDYFDSQIKRIYEHLRTATLHDYDSKRSFQAVLSIATRECDELRLKLVGVSSKEDVVQALMDVTKSYLEKMRTQPSNLNIPNEQFFNPVMVMTKQYLRDPVFFSLFFKASEAKNSLENIHSSNVKLSSAFKEHKNELADVLVKLQDQLSVLEKYRNVVPELPNRKK